MPERPLPHTRDAESRAAVGVGTCDLGIRRHPVLRMRDPLLRGQKGQQGRQGVHRERLTGRQRERLAAQLEPIAGAVPADERPIRRDDFDAQIVELEGIVAVRGVPLGEYYSRASRR